jgi:ribonuclease P protein component
LQPGGSGRRAASVLAQEEENHETHLPAFHRSPQAYPRFPCPHENQGWPRRDQRASRQGPHATGGLSDIRSDPPGAVRFHDARLTVPADFDRVFADNQRARTDAYLIMARPNAQGHARLGLVVGKRQLPRAVDRNRIKRCARASFRLLFPELPACDFVVRVLAKPVRGSEVRELTSVLRRAARRALEKWPDSATAQHTRPTHG